MTADTDHARALEVLQGGFLGEFKTVMLNGKLALVDRGGDAEMGNYVIARDVSWPGQGNLLCAFPALVALYAAAVRREEIGNGLDHMDIHSPEYKAFEQAWRDARRAYREALAAVPKAVLP